MAIYKLQVPSTVRTRPVVVPLALRPGLSQKDIMRTKEKDIIKNQGKPLLVPPHSSLPSPIDKREKNKGKNCNLSSASTHLSLSLSLLSASLSSRSLNSHSDASLWASSSSSGSGTLRPTWVAARKSRIAWVHRVSANRSRLLNRLFHLPVSFFTVSHNVLCCSFHSGQYLKRCSRVWTAYRHHPHL